LSKGLLLFTDFHAHIWQEFSKPDDEYVTDRFHKQVDTLNYMLDYATNNDLDILFAGDMFHKRGAVDTRVFNAIFESFVKHNKVNHIYLIVGNHDMINNRLGAASSLDSFNILDNVTVVNGISSFETAEAYFFLMSYGEDTAYILDKLKEAKAFARARTDKPTIFSSHLGINGAKQGATTHRLASTFSAKDISPEYFNLVYLGHYHERQEIYNDKKGYVYQRDDNDVPDELTFTHEALYGGSTIPVSFSDENQIKGFDVVTYTLPMTRTFHAISAPKFVTLKSWNNKIAQEHKHDYIRLQLPEQEAKKVSKAEINNASLRVEVTSQYKVNTRLPIEAKDSPIEVTKKYMDKLYPKEKNEALNVLEKVL
jgi:DNA repair protein SbcD/Mre11